MVGVRTSPSEYLTLELRVHSLLQHVPLYDVSLIELPGGGVGRSIADVRALDSAAPPSRIAIALPTTAPRAEAAERQAPPSPPTGIHTDLFT